ncbi:MULTISPECIES: hypothetical protein [Nonomuraea]|uniref:hypothetical protein n=1 Tax=Nonomuraea TaxID=83681 RepID=UPI0012FB2FA7|nr:hypothetical protein [Nonomuraea typhae]
MTAAKAEAASDQDVVDAQNHCLDAYATRKQHQIGYENADRLSSFLSRELTRRTARSDRDSRAARWTT